MEIIYVKVKDRNIQIKTEDDLLEGSLTNQLELLLSKFGFAKLNPNTIGNIDKMKFLDKTLGMAYFEDGKIFPIQISRKNMRHISTLFNNKT